VRAVRPCGPLGTAPGVGKPARLTRNEAVLGVQCRLPGELKMEILPKSPGLGRAGRHYSGPKRIYPREPDPSFCHLRLSWMRGTFVVKLKNRVPLLQILLSAVLTISNFGCGSSSSSAPSPPPPPPPPPAISVTVSPTSATVPAGGTQSFTPTVANDSADKGVTWTVSCSATSCGMASPTPTLSGNPTTYAAPPIAPASNLTVTLTATSVADPTKSMDATITVPAISVSVSPSSANVAVNAQHQFIGTIANDPSISPGITWTLTQNGTACSPVACGTIAPTPTVSGGLTTYTAPASVPSPATVTVTATSATDPTKSASSIVTVTVLPPPTTITYTVSAIASGTLGVTSFTDALVTIEFVGNPSQAHLHSGTPDLWQNSGTGTVTIAGVGPATLSSGPVAFDEQGGPTHSCSSSIPCFAGIGAGTPVGPTLLGITNAGFLTYDLNTPIGPLQGAPVITTSLTVGTALGGLNFSSVGATGTFTATIP
jgi:hypothetical protein